MKNTQIISSDERMKKSRHRFCTLLQSRRVGINFDNTRFLVEGVRMGTGLARGSCVGWTDTKSPTFISYQISIRELSRWPLPGFVEGV